MKTYVRIYLAELFIE